MESGHFLRCGQSQSITTTQLIASCVVSINTWILVTFNLSHNPVQNVDPTRFETFKSLLSKSQRTACMPQKVLPSAKFYVITIWQRALCLITHIPRGLFHDYWQKPSPQYFYPLLFPVICWEIDTFQGAINDQMSQMPPEQQVCYTIQ